MQGRENNPNICKQLWHVVALQSPGKNRKVLGQLPLVFWLLSKICLPRLLATIQICLDNTEQNILRLGTHSAVKWRPSSCI